MGRRDASLMTTHSHPPSSLDVDSLGVIAEARARTAETLDLASRHLDPSLVEVLEILGSFLITPLLLSGICLVSAGVSFLWLGLGMARRLVSLTN